MNIEITPEILSMLTEVERVGVERAMALCRERVDRAAREQVQERFQVGPVDSSAADLAGKAEDLYAPKCTPWSPRDF